MRPKKYRKSSNSMEHRMVKAMDMLAEFEEFRESILPALRKDVQSGMEAQQIIKKYRALAAAKMVTGMFVPLSPVSQAAARDILDRGDGKAVESKKVEHKFEGVSDEDLKALLKSKLADDGG